ncbi:DNA-binding protein inhibitor ID-2b isoform X2 [Lampris incognitus]|uniref:DNA-binding protein inhibitor ID-2b isoform X2 n=1 Tax=Lampris incognitus TaxID=2546036 RepID=UPI0024B4AB6E|nr:DNA-binding protein inhibitor ID-2b isoform X2 [Lampris incognitus]
MKAVSPARSVRTNLCGPTEHVLGVSRSKSPPDEPPVLLLNMNDCYSLLRQLVPSLAADSTVSRTEILQHVIDYILDLQSTLESSSTCRGVQQHCRRPPTSITPNIGVLTRQVGTGGCCRRHDTPEFRRAVRPADRRSRRRRGCCVDRECEAGALQASCQVRVFETVLRREAGCPTGTPWRHGAGSSADALACCTPGDTGTRGCCTTRLL